MAALICLAHPTAVQEPGLPFCTECGGPLRPGAPATASAATTCQVRNCGELLINGQCPIPHESFSRDYAPEPTRTGQADAAAYVAAARPGISQTSITPPRRTATLRFPWGPVSVPSGAAVPFGRYETHLWGLELERYDNISRRHATIAATLDGLTVCDHRSTNGTTVNGTPTTPEIAAPVRDGDILGFAADLRVRVELTGPET